MPFCIEMGSVFNSVKHSVLDLLLHKLLRDWIQIISHNTNPQFLQKLRVCASTTIQTPHLQIPVRNILKDSKMASSLFLPVSLPHPLHRRQLVYLK